MRFVFFGLVAALMLLPAGHATASIQIADLFVTGVDGSGNPLSGGDTELNYSLTLPGGTAADAELVSALPGSWYGGASNPATLNGRWIGPESMNGSDDPVDGEYVYSLNFTIGSFADLSSVVINGEWTSDNGSSIFVNGSDTGFAIPEVGGFRTLQQFELNSSNSVFAVGTNTIEFKVSNTTDGPTGLLVDSLSGSYSNVPEPATIAVWSGLGLAGIGFGAWRRRRK